MPASEATSSMTSWLSSEEGALMHTFMASLFPEGNVRDWSKKLSALYGQVLSENQRSNLTRITEVSTFAYRHWLESLWFHAHLPLQSQGMDIGTGAGFPTLPLALCRPDLNITAVDSTGKKIQALQRMSEALEVHSKVTPLCERAEVLGQNANYREQADWVSARAVADLPLLLELTLPLLKMGGVLFALKGSLLQEELGRSEKALRTLGGCFEQVLQAPNLEDSETSLLNILQIRKVAATPNEYPRATALMLKKPLSEG
jgi:16S rRNA (guanine527-N7)-methyltransferase